MKFCEKLTEVERSLGRLPDGWKYTLPTEAQWEYACRAGTNSRFSFGDEDSDLADYAWFAMNAANSAEKHAQVIGQKKPNPWGIHDLHGNICEWCQDEYASQMPGGNDPSVSATGSGIRVFRGGSWDDQAAFCRSACRNGSSSHLQSASFGFRVVYGRAIE